MAVLACAIPRLQRKEKGIGLGQLSPRGIPTQKIKDMGDARSWSNVLMLPRHCNCLSLPRCPALLFF
jgi:hypothetical protein